LFLQKSKTIHFAVSWPLSFFVNVRKFCGYFPKKLIVFFEAMRITGVFMNAVNVKDPGVAAVLSGAAGISGNLPICLAA
jgi:hypothetical protein